MVHAKNYETMSTFVKIMQKKLWPLFFPDTVYTAKTPITTAFSSLILTIFVVC